MLHLKGLFSTEIGPYYLFLDYGRIYIFHLL